jgi:D-serine deaminase-like pyridoxal phosphate-dependent protein
MTPFTTFYIENLEEADTPFLAVYPEIIQSNIRKLISLFYNKGQIRPHVKTHKCPQVVKLLLDAGITKFKCATIAEAEMLALSGAGDVLLAYQPVGPKVSRFINLILTYPACSFSCLVDNEASARQIADAAMGQSLVASVWIDLNVGMNRTGILPGAGGVNLFEYCSQLEGLTVVGLHAYDGHLTDPDSANRFAQAEAGFRPVRKLADELLLSGFEGLRIVAGSTPTIQFYASQADVECSPGTFIYWDQHYQNVYPELGFSNAGLIITRVISKPDSTTVCLDLGYKAISSEGPANERVDLLQLPHAHIISQSEEHLLVATGGTNLQVGDTVYGLPYHIGRTCNLYEACAVVEENQVKTHWLHTARHR